MDNVSGERKEPEFRVVGAGLSRTGTMSLMYALEILLPGKCYHGMKAPHHEQEWCDIMKGKYNDDEFKAFLLSNYVAAVDAPCCYYYDRIVKLFPDAKVILTIRDTKAWEESVKSTILNMGSLSYLPAYIFSYFFPRYVTTGSDDKLLSTWTARLFNACINIPRMVRTIESLNGGKGTEYFKEWVHEVESTVPEEKLLKYNVKDGWEPLCKFLDVPVPSTPFPVVNSKKEINKYLGINQRRGWLLLYESVSIPLLAYGVYKLTRQ